MDAATVESLKEALAPLMEKLGMGGEAAWEIAVRQQYVKAATSLVWVVLLVIVAVLSPRLYRWGQGWLDESHGPFQRDDRGIFLWILGIVWVCVVVVLVLGTVIEGTAGIGRLINPEWYALRDLLGLVGGQ